jgi:hypothetical protein
MFADLQKKAIYALIAALLLMTMAALALRSQRDQARAELAGFGEQVASATRMAEAHARATETALRDQADELRNKLNKETRNAQDAQTRLVADIRSGTQRMSIAAHCPAAGQAASDTGTAPGTGSESARAELDPKAAEDLVAIAADGDTAIRERNACIALYESVREALKQD